MCAGEGERRPAGPVEFWRNAMAGDYQPAERWRMIVTNLARRAGGRSCCGHHGQPGC
jgi:hypothetical protein